MTMVSGHRLLDLSSYWAASFPVADTYVTDRTGVFESLMRKDMVSVNYPDIDSKVCVLK